MLSFVLFLFFSLFSSTGLVAYLVAYHLGTCDRDICKSRIIRTTLRICLFIIGSICIYMGIAVLLVFMSFLGIQVPVELLTIFGVFYG